MKSAWAAESEQVVINKTIEVISSEVTPPHDHPWWEEILIVFERLWGDWGLVAVCVIALVVLFMFRNTIRLVIQKFLGIKKED